MFKALVRKEVRELLPLLVPAALIQLSFLGVAVGLRLGLISNVINSFVSRYNVIPFIEDSLCNLMIALGCVFAVVIGLWQTLWETAR